MQYDNRLLTQSAHFARQTSLTKAIDELTKTKSVNVKEARRRIADKLIGDNCYKF